MIAHDGVPQPGERRFPRLKGPIALVPETFNYVKLLTSLVRFETLTRTVSGE